jgi:hypothetical protein
MPFGGERAFLLCVDCGAQREILFAPFMQCKDCKGVAYRSENLSRYRRKEYRVHKLRAKIGTSTALWSNRAGCITAPSMPTWSGSRTRRKRSISPGLVA